MNARPQTAPMIEPALELLPCASIAVSETHIQAARRQRFSDAGLNELAESIRAQGVLQPVLVRPLGAIRPTDTGMAQYELVAGERRWLAAQRANLVHIPAIVRALEDDQVLEAQLVENLQREGLHQLEEAEGYQELIRLKSINAEQVGTMIGKSRSYVFARLKLLGLAPEAREAFYRGDMDASRALLVARIRDPKAQAKALKLATAVGWKGRNTYSVRELHGELIKAKATISLKAAPFALDDATLSDMPDRKALVKYSPHAGDCVGCPQRTGNATDAAADVDDPNVCTHVPCYEYKVRRHTERRIAQAESLGRAVITGEEAQKILPRKDYVVGHIDLDDVCRDVEFPEPEPKDTGDEAADEAAYQAWSERESAWKPPTYRELLAGKTLDTILVLDPRSGLVRELLPLAQANPLLKKLKLRVEDDNIHHGAPPKQFSPADYQAQQEKNRVAAEAARQRAEKEKKARAAVLAEIWKKAKGPLTRADLIDLADMVIEGWNTREGLAQLFGRAPVPGNLKDADLQRLLIISTVAGCSAATHVSDKGLRALAKRFKVNVDAVRKAALEPKPAVEAKATKSKSTVKPKSKSKEKK